jgi:hypothetical protein
MAVPSAQLNLTRKRMSKVNSTMKYQVFRGSGAKGTVVFRLTEVIL